jgi:diguanylate cyclase (GGDEF)-like protein
MTLAVQMAQSLGMLSQAAIPVWCGVAAIAGLCTWLQMAIRRVTLQQERQVQAVLDALNQESPKPPQVPDNPPSWAPALATLADQMRLQRLLVRRDPLTGLVNRRGFDEAMHKAWVSSGTHGEACALLMVDIDHFKQVNDSIGHRLADEALCHVAGVLREHVRPSDTVARWGGEEFAILLPGATHELAAVIAERLRQHVSRLPSGVTVSIGIAAFPDHAASPEALLDAADAALYRAKHQGRDRCEMASVFDPHG